MPHKLLIPAMLLIAAYAAPGFMSADNGASSERTVSKRNTAEAMGVANPRKIAAIAQGGGTNLQSNNAKLTLEEGGTWHLARMNEDHQIDLMRRVHPEPQDATFPKSTLNVIG